MIKSKARSQGSRPRQQGGRETPLAAQASGAQVFLAGDEAEAKAVAAGLARRSGWARSIPEV